MKKAVEFYENNPIKAAVEPIKADAIHRAERDEREYLDRVANGLEKANNDLEVYAPYPNSMTENREIYRQKLRKRNVMESLTVRRPGQDYRNRRDPLFVDLCPEKIEKHIERTKENAALQYDAFVIKLCKKIGDTTKAEITGNHVWGYSFLTVTLPNGETQVWKTQQIVNRSIYNLLFNQWPSRQVKKGGE